VSDGFGEIIKVFGLDLDYRFRGEPEIGGAPFLSFIFEKFGR